MIEAQRDMQQELFRLQRRVNELKEQTTKTKR